MLKNMSVLQVRRVHALGFLLMLSFCFSRNRFSWLVQQFMYNNS